MTLRRKLDRLRLAHPDHEPEATSSPRLEGDVADRLMRLRADLLALEAKTQRRAAPTSRRVGAASLPGVCETTAHGDLQVVTSELAADHCHGRIQIGDVLTASAEVLATLALADFSHRQKELAFELFGV